ncbi:DUF4350 domain-containing protein [Agromyces badenianii]|uniref:DUF4350 domain-containing protein n=1 Tax=Agromyces badenianii TaxID=2080742 RepID=UPI000D596CC9|nr:DUF4350 domain-containing protein [Agromyces badenianii]PWC03834.1 hypothetical protein DCE94_06395 [Agromyces badenianii]
MRAPTLDDTAPAGATPSGPPSPEPAGDDSLGRSAPAVTPTVRAFVRRRRAWIVIAAVLVLGALLVIAIQGGGRQPGAPLAADNPAPAGAKALVEVLRAHGVTVTEARSFDPAIEAAERGATVLVYDEHGILDRRRLTEMAAAADRLVVVEPGFAALESLAPGVRLAGAASGPIEGADCVLGPAERAAALSDGQRLLTIDDDAVDAGWRGCFRDAEFGFALATGQGPGGGDLTIVGATTVFANESIAEAGNAALAIGLAGASDDLVWYLPGPGDADAADAPTIGELTPGWVSPVMVLAIVVVVVAGIWRGRRFGPLVVENLPVHVPAGETSEGRARLYARAASRTHALDQLRVGAIRRIARALRLPRSADVDQVTDAAARATGRDEASVRRLLLDAEPTADRGLVDLAGELTLLEAEVQRTLDPRTTAPGSRARAPGATDSAATEHPDRDDHAGRRP